jgi:hypothetical protein
VTSPDLPRPVTTDQKLLTALAARMDAQNELLARILDRLPEPPPAGDGQTVELREPSTAPAPDAKPSKTPSPEPPQAPARSTRKTTPRTKPKGAS